MAESGYHWGDWAFLTYNTGTDIDAIDLNDEATLTSDEFSLDGKAACEFQVHWVEGNDGAVDGDVYVHILRHGVAWETIDDHAGDFAIDVVQNATRKRTRSISPGQTGSFKILIDNDSGRDGDLSIKVRTATIPKAT